eukprot:scaffold28892_cov51-Phaeocystis_antarctica.AAC.1
MTRNLHDGATRGRSTPRAGKAQPRLDIVIVAVVGIRVARVRAILRVAVDGDGDVDHLHGVTRLLETLRPALAAHHVAVQVRELRGCLRWRVADDLAVAHLVRVRVRVRVGVGVGVG